MVDSPPFAASWQDYRQRRLYFCLIWITYVPGVFLLGYPLYRVFDSEIPFYVVAGAWMLAFVIAGNYMLRFHCPRCHKMFFATWWYYNSFARRCVHCKLPKWSAGDTA